MFEDYIIRPAKTGDLKDIYALAKSAGPGLTNLLPDKKMLEEKITRSLESFTKTVSQPGNEFYFFVLEDLKKKKIIGTCGIFADVGEFFYSFKVSREVLQSDALKITRENLFLQLVNDYQHVTEIGTLFLDKHYRKHGLGKFLSRARYLFLADNKQRFHPKIIAEMRGRVNWRGKSPFWHALGKRFIGIKFVEADFLTASNQKKFIAELMPRTPIPVALLSEEAQDVIGKPHRSTAAAKAVLEREGFEYANYIDVFDAGPTLECKLDFIHSVRESACAKIAEIKPKLAGSKYLIGHDKIHYQMVVGDLIENEDETVSISSELARRLKCEVGETIRYLPFL